MFKPKAQPVVASEAKIPPFLKQLKTRRKLETWPQPKLQTVMLRIELGGGMKQEITTDVYSGRAFIEDTLERFNSSEITATINRKPYLKTTLGKYLAKKRSAK